jgi:hypothetical protein
MATKAYYGRALTITINSVAYSDQVTEVVLRPSQTVDTYITLTGKTSLIQTPIWELNVKGLQDWTSTPTSGFSKALWTAAAAGTNISFTLALPVGSVTGTICPVYPSAGGAADSVLEDDITFPVVGDVTLS